MSPAWHLYRAEPWTHTCTVGPVIPASLTWSPSRKAMRPGYGHRQPLPDPKLWPPTARQTATSILARQGQPVRWPRREPGRRAPGSPFQCGLGLPVTFMTCPSCWVPGGPRALEYSVQPWAWHVIGAQDRDGYEEQEPAPSEEVPVSERGTAGRAGTWIREQIIWEGGRSPTAGSRAAARRSPAPSLKY